MSEVQAQATYDVGSTQQVAAVTRTLDKLPACSDAPQEAGEPPPPSDIRSEHEPRDPKDDAALPPLMHPPGPVFGSATDPAMTIPSVSSIYKAFDGIRRSTCAGDSEKPDMALAVGDERYPYRVVQVNNACIALFKNDGALKPGYPKPLAALFNRTGFRLLDPRALYDWRRGRYIIIAVDRAAKQGDQDDGSYWIAVSKNDNADPGGDYFVYRVPMPTGGRNAFADFPRLGQDKNTIYIASNKFDTSNNANKFIYEEWLVLPKSSVYSGQGFSHRYIYNTRIDGLLTDTSHPANVWHPDDDPPAGLFVASKNPLISAPNHHACQDGNGVCNGLFVWAVDPVPVPPVVSAVAIPTTHNYALPPEVDGGNNGKGRTASINPGDTTIGGQVGYGAGSLFASLTTKTDQRKAGALLFQLQPQLQKQGNSVRITSARIVDEVLLNFGEDSTYMATIQPDPQGNTLTVFQRSGPRKFPCLMMMLRPAIQASGTLTSSYVEVGIGESAYYNHAWGDYTAVAPVLPSSGPPTMWFAGEFTGKAMYENWLTKEWCTKVGFSFYQKQ